MNKLDQELRAVGEERAGVGERGDGVTADQGECEVSDMPTCFRMKEK